MPRRVATFATAAVLVILMIVGGALLPVPYVALLPGPTQNVLGKAEGGPLISIQGRQTYPPSGRLDLVTVAYRGGPGHKLDVVTALRGWLDPRVAVVPQRAVFRQGQSAQQVRRASARKMRGSQQDAAVAALRELDIPVDTTVRVAQALRGFPAQGKLRRGDVLLRVDGKKVNRLADVSRRVSAHQPGETVTFAVRRDGDRTRVPVRTVAASGAPNRAVVGIRIGAAYDYPLQVDIRIDRIGGPSAGLAFALGIVDKLTKGDLTGGKAVAATGTIMPTGRVGKVGGVAQKMLGAHQDGTRFFLTPAADCERARKAKPAGMRLVKVRTLHGALESLRALRRGEGDVPSC